MKPHQMKLVILSGALYSGAEGPAFAHLTHLDSLDPINVFP